MMISSPSKNQIMIFLPRLLDVNVILAFPNEI